MNIINLKNKIIKSEDKIFDFFKEPKQKNHFKYYFYITKNFKQGKIDDEFKRKYKYFYVMDRAGLTRPDHFNEYFKLLKKKETSLAVILKKLYKIPRQTGDNALFLSFASKLMHTINNKLPIYDRNISAILDLPKTKDNNLNLEQKIDQRIKIYNELKYKFNKLLNDKKVLSLVNSLRIKFKQFSKDNKEFEWNNKLINNTKLLDSILWASYQID